MIGRLLYAIATLIRRLRARRLQQHAPLCGYCAGEFSMGNYPAGPALACHVCRYTRTRWRFDGGRLQAVT